MVERECQKSLKGVGRREFLSGAAALLAAAAYTSDISDEVAAQVTSGDASATQTVSSPDGSITVTVDVSSGVPMYSVAVDGATHVQTSRLGFDFQNQPTFGIGADGTAGTDIEVTGSERGTDTENWTPVWGQYDSVTATYNYLTLGLAETNSPGRSGNLQFRVFDDGIGFRFAFDTDFAANAGNLVITAENTEFNFGGDYTAWWIRNEFVDPRFEQEYRESSLSNIDAGSRTIRPNGNRIRTGAHTPLTIETDDGTYLSVHEADLEDYATMSLAARSDSGGTAFTTQLAPLPDGSKVSTSAPHVTPWRTIQVGSAPGDLVESSLIPLLNEEIDTSVLPTEDGSPDTDWITPKKYVGIWWTMIAGSAHWTYKSDSEIANDGNNPAAYIHGARTERMKRYMQFASEHAIDSVLVEGWNEGWSTYGADAADAGTGLEMGVNDAYPDFSVSEVTAFGLGLDTPVEMTIHNETSGNIPNYEDEILNNDVFQEYEDAGIRSIKNGYVSDPGLFITGQDRPTHNHHCQLAVNHHRTVIRNAAQDRQMLEIHEGIKPTGERRTYPNVGAREVVEAQEYDGFGALASDVDRDHHVTLPFTRMLAGPMSYQPGIFDITFNEPGGQVQTTRAKQLAMYPTYHGGLQMAADRIEAYVDGTFEVGEFVQAPSGRLDGMITADKWRNAFGAHYVPIDPNREPDGSSVTFTVENVESAGTFDLHLRYASDETENTARVQNKGPQATLAVNGSTQKISPSFTDYWDDWQVFTTQISLEEGDNTVAIELNYDDSGGTFTGDTGGFNLNTIGVTPTGAGAPFPATYTDYDGSVSSDENFGTEPAFAFIRDVPASGWDETSVVDASVGDYIVTARRTGNEWYLGAMTDGNGRAIDIPLDFLTPKANGWKMELYTDGVDTTVETNPTDVRVTTSLVSAGDSIVASMAAGGGTAVRLVPATAEEATTLPDYTKPTQSFDVSIADTTEVGSSFITVTGSNASDTHIGGTTLEVLVDGTQRSVRNVRLAPGASNVSVPVEQTLDEPGTYTVTVRDARSGTVFASESVSVVAPQTIATFTDPTGDDAGPGSYTYPTGDEFTDGAFDLERFEIQQTSSSYRFVFEVANLTNVYDRPNGFSPQLFVLWVSDPNGSGGRTTPLTGDHAIDPNVDFSVGWDYRLRVDGGHLDAVDATGAPMRDGDGTAIEPDIDVDKQAGTVTLSIPDTAFDGADIFDLEVLPVAGSSEFGAFRPVEATASTYRFGDTAADADTVDNAPYIIDMVPPTGTSQSEALSYGDEQARVPFTPVYDAALDGAARVATLGDESGDDNGWGPVTYPPAGKHADPGSLDLERLEVYEDDSRYYFAARFAEEFDNPYDKSAGFSRPHVRMYVRDPSQSGTSSKGGFGCHPYGNKQIIEDDGWHQVFDIQPTYKAVQDTGFNPIVTSDVGRRVPERNDTIIYDVAKSVLPNVVRNLDLTVVAYAWDPEPFHGVMKIEEKQYAATNSSGDIVEFYRPNTANSNYYHTNVVDLFTGDGQTQSQILDPSVLSDTAGGTFAEYQIPLLSVRERANSIREALAGDGPVTEAQFDAVQRAYENGTPIPGTGGLVPAYEDVRAIAVEVGDQ